MFVQVAPGNACSRNPENPIENKPMVPRTTPAARPALDHEWLKASPFLVAHQTPDQDSLPKSYLESDTGPFGNPLCQQILVAAVGDSGYVARLGGDEFAILVAGCVNPLDVSDITDRIFESLHLPFDLAGQLIFATTSIGIAMAPTDAANVEQLLSNADLALYSAKNAGGGKRTFFAQTMQNGAEQLRRLSADLRQALANNEFEIWYQPQFSMVDFQLSGVEALLRWHHPVHGLLLPQIFMDVLESDS